MLWLVDGQIFRFQLDKEAELFEMGRQTISGLFRVIRSK